MQVTIDALTASCFALGFVLCLALLTAASSSGLVALAIGAGAVGSIPGCILMASLDRRTAE